MAFLLGDYGSYYRIVLGFNYRKKNISIFQNKDWPIILASLKVTEKVL
jgi:hypothetical protein